MIEIDFKRSPEEQMDIPMMYMSSIIYQEGIKDRVLYRVLGRIADRWVGVLQMPYSVFF
jgi:hypothetical protein